MLVGRALPRDWPYPDCCGFAAEKDGEGMWSIAFVSPATPAEAAGLAPGDRLLRLGGDDARGLHHERLREIASGEGPLRLLVQRSANRLDLVVDRRPLI